MANAIQINEDTWRIEDDFVRFFLLLGTERALMIDSGVNSPDARKIAESITSLPLELLNTHADPDHISGNQAFDTVYMSKNELENYHFFAGFGKITPVSEGTEIDLGDRLLKIIDIPGHTPGSIAILDVKNRVLYSGDTVQDGNIYMFGRMRDLRNYIKSLEHLSEFKSEFDQIMPSHGSLPLAPDQIDKLTTAAVSIRDGQSAGEPIKIMGREVKFYRFSYVGYYCD